MKSSQFYIDKATELLNKVNSIDIEKLNNEINNKRFEFLKDRLISDKKENRIDEYDAEVLNDLIFQIKLLYSSHLNSNLFLERLEYLTKEPAYNFNSAKSNTGLIKSLKEFIDYLNGYDLE